MAAAASRATARILDLAKTSKELEPGSGGMINLDQPWEVFRGEPCAYFNTLRSAL